MATEMITWARRQVFKQFGLSGAERLVLMLLADNASWNEDTGGWYAFPFQKTLVDESGLSRRTVQRALARFVELGLVSAERRQRPSGFLAGNGYVFHPEVVDEPITLTRADAVESGGVTMAPPDIAGSVTVTPPDIPGSATTTPPDIAGSATTTPEVEDRRVFRRRHRDASVDNSGAGVRVTPGRRHSDASDAPPVAHAARVAHNPRARPNRHSEPSIETSSSSSSSETVSPMASRAGGAAGEDDEDGRAIGGEGLQIVRGGTGATPATRLGEHMRVDLDALAGLVAAHVGLECPVEQLQWLVESVLGRSKRRVGRPSAFVSAAVVNDPAGWRAELVDRFGRSPATRPAGREPSPVLCPIPEHAAEDWREHNCPPCRKWHDFPAEITAVVFAQLTPQVQEAVRAAEGVEVVTVPEAING